MAGENHEHGAVSFTVPGEVDDWLTAEARRRDETRAEVCRRLMAAAHVVATDAGDETDVSPVSQTDLEEFEGQLDAQRAEFTELLEDVRSRVVQVKRETDDKAPADHEHDSHVTDEEIGDLHDDLDELEYRLETGFDNFEQVLEHLLGRTDDLEERSTVLARTLAAVRDRSDGNRHTDGLERLRVRANRLGIRTATCEDCDSSVDIALLNARECPHCESPIADVAENSSVFGSDRLVVGDPASKRSAPDDQPSDESADSVTESGDSEQPAPSDKGNPTPSDHS
ncbi:hypothetical protein AB7C87_03990 [Natrarchaeobius sp. A-rgal3]|uniref:hypothetical protein n=1 Tax=Natrarchaeobius versutus TaxID=1679078 RepID=UPI00350EFFAD